MSRIEETMVLEGTSDLPVRNLTESWKVPAGGCHPSLLRVSSRGVSSLFPESGGSHS